MTALCLIIVINYVLNNMDYVDVCPVALASPVVNLQKQDMIDYNSLESKIPLSIS